ncbi:MAG: hypothetical protein H7248_01570, partial [Microbacteriaceae bacterium]|nr:hypothetical protein [Microbacteriaceae bacterium]
MTNFFDFTAIPDNPEATAAADFRLRELLEELRLHTTGASVSYELVGEFRTNFQGATLGRIRATKDIPSQNVARGDIGGWVEGQTLSTGRPRLADSAWVSDNAEVFGNARLCHNALVAGGTRVSGNAIISDDAGVSGHALVNNDSEISGGADVRGVASISDHAHVFDNAQVSGHARIFDNARVYGNARVTEVTRIG